MQKKFSKDPKVKLISIEDFFAETKYLPGIKRNCWNDEERPDCGIYYKITPKFLILIDYTSTTINFGMDSREKLESIQVAYRDRKTEYDLLDSKMKGLLQKREKFKRNKKLNKEIGDLETSIKLLKDVKYSEQRVPIKPKPFESYIADTKYKTPFDELKGKYVVFDVETNGTRKANDDLLSISIYDPTSGKCYNRYLPLDLQPLVLTTWINGIKDEDLENTTHLTQKELDKIIDFFDLKNKTLLSFSGGKGTFDYAFITNYCKRHKLVGFEDLHCENIKSVSPNPGYGFEGQMSKDNLCRLLKIEGVQNVHSGMNDCILEWKLFEKIKTEPLFFIDKRLFRYHEGYIVPISYLNTHPELITFAKIDVPHIAGKAKLLYEFSLPKEIVKKVKKFETNITGISIENGINACLKVEKQNNVPFLAENKRQLDYMGSLDSRITEIPIEIEKDGTIKSLDIRFTDDVKEINEATGLITSCLSPVFDFIKREIFTGDKIMSQELSISKDGKVLAVCDLSDSDSVLEIKTFKVDENGEIISESLARQLYYESNGRKTFALSIDFVTHYDRSLNLITDAVNVRIYKITLEEYEPKPIERTWVLSEIETRVLEIISNDVSASSAEIAEKSKLTTIIVGKIIKSLILFRYIEKEDPKKKTSNWIVLRDVNEIKTKYLEFEGEITLLLNDAELKK